jgi:hypothetical protein
MEREMMIVPLRLPLDSVQHILNVLGQMPLAQALATGVDRTFLAVQTQANAALAAAKSEPTPKETGAGLPTAASTRPKEESRRGRL